MAFEDALATVPKGLKRVYTKKYLRGEHYDAVFARALFDMADDDGVLSPGDAIRVLGLSGIPWEDYKSDNGSDSRHPADILCFLGF